MISVRPGNERGRADFGWLDSRHTFSFGDYHDPQRMGFGPLRVINEDRVKPGQGFGTPRSPRHGDPLVRARRRARAQGQHRHRVGVIRPADVQVMSAGTGIRHSEFNPSPTGAGAISCRSG